MKEVKKLSSLNVCIPLLLWKQLWKWYPPRDSTIHSLYEKISNIWLEIDVIVVSEEEFVCIIEKSVTFNDMKVSFYESNRFGWVNNYSKWFIFHRDFHSMIREYLPVIKPDNDCILTNMNTYLELYHRYILHKKRILKLNDLDYKEELIKYFLDYRIFEFKVRYKFYKTLYEKSYNKISEALSWSQENVKNINYFKNISVHQKEIIWRVYKVFNLESSRKIPRGAIMIAQDTNPEFLGAFYKSKCICVETSSELSHAAITCKELWIPLALWARDIFFVTDDGKEIRVNTEEKVIYT